MKVSTRWTARIVALSLIALGCDAAGNGNNANNNGGDPAVKPVPGDNILCIQLNTFSQTPDGAKEIALPVRVRVQALNGEGVPLSLDKTRTKVFDGSWDDIAVTPYWVVLSADSQQPGANAMHGSAKVSSDLKDKTTYVWRFFKGGCERPIAKDNVPQGLEVNVLGQTGRTALFTVGF